MTRGPGRAGYTLTEVLIASVLVVVLMSACWNLMSLYGSFLQAGRDDVRERQLARSLFQLVEQDLRLVNAPTIRVDKPAPVPPRVPEMSGTETLVAPAADAITPTTNLTDSLFKIDSTVRFEGTGDWLSVTYLPESEGGENQQASEPGVLGAESDFADTTAYPDSEARTVLYFFVNPETFSPTDRALPFGLHRIEATTFDFEDARQQNAAGRITEAGEASGVFSRLAFDALFEPAVELTEALEESAIPAFEPTHDHAPEIVRVQFEYHDGNNWQGRWNTRNRRSLPTMLRMSWWIVSSEELQTLQETLEGQALGEEEPESLPGIRPRRYQRTVTFAPVAIPKTDDFGGVE